MLYTLKPLAYISATIVPLHFSFTLPLIFTILTSILISTSPSKFPLSTFLIIVICTYVLITWTSRYLWRFSPFSLAMLKAWQKVAHISAGIRPGIHSIPIWLSFLVLPSICITIWKIVYSIAMLLTGSPLTLILITLCSPIEHPMALSFPSLPLTYVTISTVRTLPHPIALSYTPYPFTIIYVTALWPSVMSMTVSLTLVKPSHIDISILIFLIAATMT